jgi:hypothetical protein
LIGPRERIDLNALSSSISTRRATPLFGSLPAPIPLAALDMPVVPATE